MEQNKPITLQDGEDATWNDFLKWLQRVDNSKHGNRLVGAMPDIPKEIERRV